MVQDEFDAFERENNNEFKVFLTDVDEQKGGKGKKKKKR